MANVYPRKGPKPRTIEVRGTEIFADGVKVSVSTLKRQELMSAVSQRFECEGTLTYVKNVDLLDAWIKGHPPVNTSQEPATDKQIWKLARLGISHDPNITKSEASRMIAKAVDGDKPAPADKPEVWRPVPADNPYVGSSNKPLTDVDMSEYVKLDQHYEAVKNLVEQVQTIKAEVRALEGSKPKVINILDRPTVKVSDRTHEAFEDVLMCTLAGNDGGLWPLLVGPAGTGKSTIAEHVAAALSVDFYAFSCGPTKTETALVGYMNANGIYVGTDFRQAYEHGGLIVLDELDASHPGVITSLNNALANRVLMFPDGMVKRHADFYCIGTANTFGTGATRQYVGRNQLDSATLDRFGTAEINYDENLENALALAILPNGGTEIVDYVHKVRQNIVDNGVLAIAGTRSIIGTCRQMARGRDKALALESCLWRGMDTDTRRKVTP